MGGANRCPTHLDSAPPPVAVGGATADWISHLAVLSAHSLRKLVLPGLIASVRGEPDIHSPVGTLPHESAPILDQMRLKGAPVNIEGPSLTPKQLAVAIAYGSHNSCDRYPSFLRKEMRDFVNKGFLDHAPVRRCCWFGWILIVTGGSHRPEGPPGLHCR